MGTGGKDFTKNSTLNVSPWPTTMSYHTALMEHHDPLPAYQPKGICQAQERALHSVTRLLHTQTFFTLLQNL